jgi:hypothetical protein
MLPVVVNFGELATDLAGSAGAIPIMAGKTVADRPGG